MPRHESPSDGPPDPPRILNIPSLRLPPHSIEAEMGVLGCCLFDNGVIPEVLEIIEGPADFYRAAHQILFRVAIDLHEQGISADLVTIVEELERRDELERVGGDSGIDRIMAAVPHAACARDYAAIVRRKSLLRGVIEAMDATLREAYEDRTPAEALVDRAEARIFALSERHVAGRTFPVNRAMVQVMGRIADRASGRAIGLQTGFVDVDEKLDGLRPGQLVVIAARPSMGKSAIVSNICENLAVSKKSSLLVSLEMGAEELGERFLSGLSRVPVGKFRRPSQLSVDDYRAIAVAQASGEAASILIDESPGRTMAQIIANARRAVLRNAVALVAVDYIQLIDPGDSGRDSNREQQVAEISRRLKEMARRLAVPVLAVAQLNRKSESREDRRPRLSDLRESGQIEQDADVVLLIHRPSYYDPNDRPGVAEVIIAKNRNGPTGAVQLVWKPEMMRFENYYPGADEGYRPADNEPF